MSPLFPVLLAMCVGVWLSVFDADFATFGYDLHRQLMGRNDISSKSVWIVGASSGIGEFLVYELIQSGCTKLILSSRREKQLQRVKREALALADNANNIQIVIKTLDLMDFATNRGYNDEFVSSLMTDLPFDDIDILVVNSGMIQIGYAMDNDVDVLQRVSQVNTFGPVALIQSMVRCWQQYKSNTNKLHQIALTSSIAGKLGAPKQSAYAMTKWAVNGYLETLRMELMDENVDINVFSPGHIELNEHSVDATSSSLDDKRIKRGGSGSEGRMTLRRCASLYVTALEYSITDAMVSTHPVLAFSYLRQYLPALYHPLTKVILPQFQSDYKKPNTQS